MVKVEGNITVLTGVMVEVSGNEGNVTVLTGVMVELSVHEGLVPLLRPPPLWLVLPFPV